MVSQRMKLLLAAARAARGRSACQGAPILQRAAVVISSAASGGVQVAAAALRGSSNDVHMAWSFGSAAAAAALLASAAGTVASPALLDSDSLEPEALQSLARDLADGSSAAKERAVAMLSSLTMYVDHHDAILATPGVLQALLASVADESLVPQVRNIALTCTADLLKAPQAHHEALATPGFAPHLLQALRAEGEWRHGLDDGQAAQAQAARCAAELAGNPEMHSALIKTGLAEQVATQAARLVHEFGSVAGSYASASEVPASMDAVSTMEEERFIAAAVKGLAGSKQGAALLAQHPQTLQGVAHWAGRSKDPILQRWGVGALAHLAAASKEAAASVAEAGGLPALVTGLNSGDPQAQCFASAAIGSMASRGDGSIASSLAQQGMAPALRQMLQADSPGLSEGVRQGVRRCALRCINTCAASSPQLAAALQQAGIPATLQALSAEGRFKSEELQRLAQAAAQRLGAAPSQPASHSG